MLIDKMTGFTPRRYRGFVLTSLEDDRLKLIRKSLGGFSHFASEKFQVQINELLLLKQKKKKGRPRKQ